ncbi:MAG TPA: Ger(x)C family spore germination protein [Firmicutes bacterium]|nr:Ger(x)C family spore germination protein [Bacillota bacterium]
MADDRRKNRIFRGSLGLLLLSLVLSGGCWDRRELETLAVVTGMGLNYAAQGDGYEVAFQIVRAAQLQSASGGAGGGGELKPVWILRSTGPTVFEAVRNATFQSSRRLFLSHNQVLIISEAVAKGGLLPALEFFVRDHEPRNTQWLLLTPDEPVEILDAAAGLERVSALAIVDLMKQYQLTSKIKPVYLADYIKTRIEKTTANTLPIIRIYETAGKKELLLDGTAILKEDRLVGFLDHKETRGLLWVLGEVRGGVITVDLPGGGKATFEIFDAIPKVKVEFKEGRVQVKIEIKERAGLGAQTTYADLSTPEQFKKLENLQTKAIEDEIRAALAKAKAYKADIFGFGEYLYKHDHRTWQRLQKEWERYFVDAQVEIKIEAMVEELGLVTRPATYRELRK